MSKKRYVIVRCRDAGVHAGEFVSRKGREVKLTNARRLWRWWSRFSLTELAKEGPLVSKLSENRYSTPSGTIELLDACEVIDCTDSAAKAIKGVPDAIK
jgi:hypothetical protein